MGFCVTDVPVVLSWQGEEVIEGGGGTGGFGKL